MSDVPLTADDGVREPKQARSRERVRRILECADQILAAEGYDALTMRRLAEAASIPMGTIYQFFRDKDAIVARLAGNYLNEFEELMDDLLKGARDVPAYERVGIVFDAFAQEYRSHRGYQEIWLGGHLSDDLRRADEANNEANAAGLARMLIADDSQTPPAALMTACRTAVFAGDGILQRAFRADPAGDAGLLTEGRIALAGYLADALERLGPAPARKSTSALRR